jgi:hypothetical protein
MIHLLSLLLNFWPNGLHLFKRRLT